MDIGDTILMLLVSVAYGLFAYFSFHSFFEYEKELTGLNQLLVLSKELPMPMVTVCSQDIFKNLENDTNTQMVLQNLNNYTYTWGDLFDDMMLYPSLSYTLDHEIFSTDLGLCYSFRSKQNATITEAFPFIFYMHLLAGKTYQV